MSSLTKFKNDPKAKRYYWLKLKNDFFEQKEIKLLRKIAGGDTFTIIYLKMLLKSLQDDGSLYFEAIGDDFTEELALDLDEDTENVALTLRYLESKKLLEIIEKDEYFLKRVPEMVGSESYSAERMRRLRTKEKNNQLLPNNASSSQCDSDVTKRIEQERRAEKDLEKREKRVEQRAKQEKELELEIDKESEQDKEPEVYGTSFNSLEQDKLTLEDCFELFKDSFGIIVDTERRTFTRLSKEYGIDFVYEAIDKTDSRKSNGIEIKVPVAYITSLLKEWREKGFTSIDDIYEEQETFNEEYEDEDKFPF